MAEQSPTPITQPFPWQLLSNESIALSGDLVRIDQEIAALRHRADFELKPRRDVLAVRYEQVRDALDRYEQWQRESANVQSAATRCPATDPDRERCRLYAGHDGQHGDGMGTVWDKDYSPSSEAAS